MELILVNSVKLKIILTPADMEDMDISNDTLDYDSAKTRKAFRRILEKAKLETGFDIKHDRIYVQAFPSHDGGCEMFLTRRGKLLPEPEDAECTYLKKKYRFSRDSVREKREYIAASTEIDNIIDLCIRLKKEGFCGASSLYTLDGKYYLTISFSRRYPSFMQDSVIEDDVCRCSFISDYADISFAESLPVARLAEHGKLLAAPGAVQTLAKSFAAT